MERHAQRVQTLLNVLRMHLQREADRTTHIVGVSRCAPVPCPTWRQSSFTATRPLEVDTHLTLRTLMVIYQPSNQVQVAPIDTRLIDNNLIRGLRVNVRDVTKIVLSTP